MTNSVSILRDYEWVYILHGYFLMSMYLNDLLRESIFNLSCNCNQTIVRLDVIIHFIETFSFLILHFMQHLFLLTILLLKFFHHYQFFAFIIRNRINTLFPKNVSQKPHFSYVHDLLFTDLQFINQQLFMSALSSILILRIPVYSFEYMNNKLYTHILEIKYVS